MKTRCPPTGAVVDVSGPPHVAGAHPRFPGRIPLSADGHHYGLLSHPSPGRGELWVIDSVRDVDLLD